MLGKGARGEVELGTSNAQSAMGQDNSGSASAVSWLDKGRIAIGISMSPTAYSPGTGLRYGFQLMWLARSLYLTIYGTIPIILWNSAIDADFFECSRTLNQDADPPPCIVVITNTLSNLVIFSAFIISYLWMLKKGAPRVIFEEVTTMAPVINVLSKRFAVYIVGASMLNASMMILKQEQDWQWWTLVLYAIVLPVSFMPWMVLSVSYYVETRRLRLKIKEVVHVMTTLPLDFNVAAQKYLEANAAFETTQENIGRIISFQTIALFFFVFSVVVRVLYLGTPALADDEGPSGASEVVAEAARLCSFVALFAPFLYLNVGSQIWLNERASAVAGECIGMLTTCTTRESRDECRLLEHVIRSKPCELKILGRALQRSSVYSLVCFLVAIQVVKILGIAGDIGL